MSTPITAGQAITAGETGDGVGLIPAGELSGFATITIGVSTQTSESPVGEDALEYVEGGVIEDAGWSFTPGQHVYADRSGFPTQAVADLDAYRLIGVALSSTKVLLLLPQPAYGRAGAAQRPMSIGDDWAIPHQATAAERALHKSFYGIGGTDAPQPSAAKEITFEYVSNTSVRLKMMGLDGVVRSANLVLS